MSKLTTGGALIALCVAATAGCGGGDDASQANGGGGGGGGGGSTIKIGLVVPLSGAAAIPRIYVSPAEMAIEDINKAGGVDGRMLELDKIDSGFTPQTAITAVNKAVGDGVSVIVGLPITSQNVAIRSIVDKAQIPVLQLSVGDESSFLGEKASEGASKYSFRIGNANSTQVRAAATFAAEELQAKKIGLLADVDSAKSVQAAFEKAVTEAKAEVGPIRTFPIAPKDLTNEALAMKGNDAVVNWSYPNNMALAVKQMIQNDVLIPTVGSQSAANIVTNKLLPVEMLKYLYGGSTCNPADDSREGSKKWFADFQSRKGFEPEQSSAETYDAITIFAKVVAPAGDAAGQLTALEGLDYADGVCALRYNADDKHNTAHSSVVISFEGGKSTTAKAFDFTENAG